MTPTRSVALGASLLLALAVAFPATADDEAAKALTRPIDRMISLIRFGKFEEASVHLDHLAMSKEILRDCWEELSEADRAEFAKGYGYLMESLSFPKVQENFKYLDEVFYEPARFDGDKARVKSVIVIDHPVKGTEELSIEYVMLRHEDTWRIFDVYVEDESTLTGIREDQIEELLDEGGPSLVMKRLREKVDEARKNRAKQG